MAGVAHPLSGILGFVETLSGSCTSCGTSSTTPSIMGNRHPDDRLRTGASPVPIGRTGIPLRCGSLTSMPDFACQECGTSFSLSQEVLDRYPGWTPKHCRDCRDRRSSTAPAKAKKKTRTRTATASENLTLAEVLARYTDGPDTGVFTDGSSVPNPGPGGWGSVYVVDGEVVACDYGHDPDTTNNRMELTALIKAIDLVPSGTTTTLYTDSNLAVQTVNQWAAGWERNGWKRKTGPIKNLELVKELYGKMKARPELGIEWVQAHAGNRWNEYADALSTAWQRDEL